MNLLFTITFFCRPAFAAAPLLLLSFLSLTAQPSDTIVPNPKAVTLHNIWKVTGKEEQDRVGDGVGFVPDLNGDSLNEFLVHFGREAKWKLFYGGKPTPDTVPEWEVVISAAVPSYPIIGDFWGNDRKTVISGQYRFWDTPERYLLYFYKQQEGSFATVPDPLLDPLSTMTPAVLIGPTDIIAADLDGRTGDELILSIGVTVREGKRSQVGEIWIYAGGPEFQVDEPTLIIRDQEANTKEDEYRAYVADFDGDSFPDLALTARYADGSKLKLWFGRDGSPWNWTDTPDRTILLDGSGLNRRLTLGQFDGDTVIDLVGFVVRGEERLVTCYLSGSGKDIRSRAFSQSDADQMLRTSMMVPAGSSGVYLNDTTHRYGMLPLIGPSKYDRYESMLLFFSGGERGPNGTWDAEYAPSRDGVTAGPAMRLITPLPDCNGDGWDDILLSDDEWWIDVFRFGIAMVLAGGPEIPNDDPTVSVREEPVAGESGGLYLWPNPVVDELNVAWKGNLKRMPARFEVHDMTGLRVASGQVEPSVGAAVWSCATIASGSYLLTAYDETDTVIASVRIAKQ